MEKITPIQRFFRLLKPDGPEVRNIYIYAIFNGLINLSLPLGIQSIINLIQGGEVSTSWLVLVLIVSLGIALSGIVQINQLRITENLQQKIFTRSAFEFAFRIPRIKLKEFYNAYAPELMNRFFDVVSVQKNLSKILLDFSTATIQVTFGLILLSLYHPFFIVLSLFLVSMLYVIIRMTAKKGLQTSLEESKNKYKIAHWLEELARTNYAFKLAGETDLPLKRVDKLSDKYVNSREAHFSVLIKQYSLMVAFKVMVALGLLLIGGILVIEQKMNIGQFVAAEIIILLIINSVEKLVLSFETIYDMLTSIEKIGQVTDLELDSFEGMAVTSPDIKINFSDVTFSYPNEEKVIINEVNFEIKQGEKIVLCGNNESGKSTLLYLISGLYAPTGGTIAYNDVPASNYNPFLLKNKIGAFLRDDKLFEGTLLENITLGREEATFENVQWAIKELGLTSLLNHLPDGYDTSILPHGKQLSPHVQSKILIARAIATKPRILLLENAFSLLNEDEQENIASFLLDKSHDWTIILSSIKDFHHEKKVDRRLRLVDGQIIKEA